jgi:hypothetical protein
VGWDFVRPKDVKPFVGFGASRFAAIEFCKTLRTNVTDLGKVWDYAWLIDDNVVALENFAGLEKVEAAFPPSEFAQVSLARTHLTLSAQSKPGRRRHPVRHRTCRRPRTEEFSSKSDCGTSSY